MPGCNIYNEHHRQLLVNFFDLVTAEDLKDMTTSLSASQSIAATELKHISFSAATGFADDVTLEMVQEVGGELIDTLKSSKKTALVAPSEESLGVARVLEEFFKQGPGMVRIFMDEEEAFQWLGGDHHQWAMMRDRISTMCTLPKRDTE